MTKRATQILYVEDKLDNVPLIEAELSKAGMLVQLNAVQSRAAFLRCMQAGPPDLVIAYCEEEGFAGLECLNLRNQLAPSLPFIILSHSLGEWAIEAMREGASDVLLQDKLYKLPASVTRALQEAADRRQQQQAEEHLQLSQRQLRNLFKMTPVGVFRCDVDKSCFFVNDRYCEITGLKPEEAMGVGWINALHPDDRDFVLNNWYDKKGVLEQSKAVFRYLKPSGEVSWVIGQCISETDSQGRLMGYLGSITDITRLKVTEEALLEKNSYLTKVNQELDSFVYSASHNLRAPLTSLMGLVNLIRLGQDNLDVQRRVCDMMEHSLHRLDGFIRDILDHSRNARLSVQYQLIDAQSLIEEVLQEFSLHEDFSLIDVQLRVQENHAFWSDLARLRIILRNLLSNCIRYRSRHDNPEIIVTVRVDPAEVVIQVNDNGIGIRKERQGRVFEMFYRADEQRSGSGLGLYITREVVNKLGGTIELSSEPSKGTTVRVVLPNQVKAAQAGKQGELLVGPGWLKE